MIRNQFYKSQSCVAFPLLPQPREWSLQEHLILPRIETSMVKSGVKLKILLFGRAISYEKNDFLGHFLLVLYSKFPIIWIKTLRFTLIVTSSSPLKVIRDLSDR